MLEQLNNVGLSRVLNLNVYTSCGTGSRLVSYEQINFLFQQIRKVKNFIGSLTD